MEIVSATVVSLSFNSLLHAMKYLVASFICMKSFDSDKAGVLPDRFVDAPCKSRAVNDQIICSSLLIQLITRWWLLELIS